jgi:AraC-like DNA-binding protein
MAVCRILDGEDQPGLVGVHERKLTARQWIAFQSGFNGFIGALLDELFANGAVVDGPETGEPRVDAILDDLRMQASAGPLPYAKWQRELGLSRSQLDRIAVRALGHTLRTQRDNLLLATAARRLADPAHSVKEVAASLGFVDSSHFCRWIRRASGQSPDSFRAAV